MDAGFEGTVGLRLRRAREAAGLSLDDVAARTRVPTRHLDAMEEGAWDKLPGPTYVAGFAKSYADVVGLPRAQIGEDIRAEMGVRSQAAAPAYEPADPTRVPPRTLAISALVLLVLLGGGYFLLREDALDEAQPQFTTPVEQPAPATRATAPTPALQQPTGPVVVTAREPVWVQIEQRGGEVFVSRQLNAGERVEVSATATDPIIRTGRAELLDISVGGRSAPPLGPPNQLVKDRSLRPEALFPSAGAANGPAGGANGATNTLPAQPTRP